jgi:hypothetical protein
MLLDMLHEVLSVKHGRLHVPGYQETCSLGITRWKKNGAKGRLSEKIAAVLLVLATFKTLRPFNIFHPLVSTLQVDFYESWATRENWVSCPSFKPVLLDSDVSTSEGKGPHQTNKPSHSWSWATPYPGLYKKPIPQQELSNNFCVNIFLQVVKISSNSGG